jgi:transitional endoplasmic reticulum ATPase
MRAYMEDFKMAARAVSRKASAIPAEGPKLSDIVLPASVRHAANSLLYRLINWEEIKDRGGEPPTGVMLYGPPGTGKSMFVKALARELGDWHVFEVCASDVIQNPKVFQQTVDMAAAHRPAIVFLDEADELLANRSCGWNSGATNQVLKSIDGFGGKVPEVVFIAATNRIDAIDPAALRGGRFAERIHMDLLRGEDLRRFVQNCIDELPKAKLRSELNADVIASEFVEAAPADVVSYIRSLVNASFWPSVCG